MKMAYLITSNNIVGSGRCSELHYTEEEWNAMTLEEQEKNILETAWECCEVYPDDEIEKDRIVLVVSVGLVGCDDHIETDVADMVEWDSMDVSRQNELVREAFWQSIEANVVFAESYEEADKHTRWGYCGD